MNSPTIILLLLVPFGIAAVWAWWMKRRSRIRALYRLTPLSKEAIACLEKDWPLYHRLPASLKPDLHADLNEFLAIKHFEGCGGLELNDDMKVLIAAQACLLLVNREVKVFPQLKTILVYPEAYYTAPHAESTGEVVIEDEASVNLGESWSTGAVVLSWEDVLRGGRNAEDGMNLTLHEFAHQLDQENSVADGAPVLNAPGDYHQWSQVMSRAYDELLRRLERGGRPLLDAYAATNAAEFFSVATETFFEKPRRLRRESPALYRQLMKYYRVDPAAWPRIGEIPARPANMV